MESIGAKLSEMQRTPLASAHVAALRGNEAGERSQQRRLAGAVGTDDDDELAGSRRGGDTAHDGSPTEGNVDVGELEPHRVTLPSRNVRGNAVAKGLVRRRNDRVIMNLPVEVITDGKKIRAVSQDLSPYGMFIRLSPPLPAGSFWKTSSAARMPRSRTAFSSAASSTTEPREVLMRYAPGRIAARNSAFTRCLVSAFAATLTLTASLSRATSSGVSA